MKLLHFLIIIISIVISLTVLALYLIPFVVPIQPISTAIIGYTVSICNPDPNNRGFSYCTTPRPTIVGNDSFTLYVGDRFTLEFSIYNPNLFSIDKYSTLITLDRNILNPEGNGGCSFAVGSNSIRSLESTEITIPPFGCALYIANSAGITKVTVQTQYQINQKTYSISTSKTFTIHPPRGGSYYNGTLEEENQQAQSTRK